nr:hypothetical protein [Tanacetum cinerariifolium]GFB46775.1 hypothetical protein [Tanacetum cinerariifolium]
MKPNNSWGSSSSNVPSPLIACRLSKSSSAQANGQVLQEEELEFLADPAKIALMANLLHYGSDNLAETLTSPALQDDLILSVIEQLKTQVVT